ncbi:MAG: hypothetical protein ACJ72L_03195 [Marmoricola sp.]
MKFRLATAGGLAALVVAGSGSGIAVAGTSATDVSKPDPGDQENAAVQANGGTVTSDIESAAHDLGVTPSELLDALGGAKQAAVAAGVPASPGRVVPDIDAAAASLAASLDVSEAAARQAFTQLMSAPKRVVTGEVVTGDMVDELATFLHITAAQSQHIWDAADHGGLEPTSQEFADLAASIDLTPAQLNERLRAFKGRIANDHAGTSGAKTDQS